MRFERGYRKDFSLVREGKKKGAVGVKSAAQAVQRVVAKKQAICR